jgi:iron complex transport system ATP-binding protein
MTSDHDLLARHVSFSYGSAFAVRDVSLSLAPGDTVALVGPNGSGKTTMLRLLSGALKAQTGAVTINGRPIGSSSPRELARKIAVVPQHVDPTLALTVEAMVALGRTPYTGLLKPMSPLDRAALGQAMEATETVSLRGKRFNELSGGEQRRVALAMAMAQGTSYLLLDEPTVHLDLHHQHAFFELLQTLRTVRDIGILAVMHDLNLAALYFDTIVVMDGGSVRARGAPADILRRRDAMDVFRAPLDIVSHPQSGIPQVLLQRGTPER